MPANIGAIELGKGKVEADVVRLAECRLLQTERAGKGIGGKFARGVRQFPMATRPGQSAGEQERDIGAGLGIEDLQQIAQLLRLDLQRRLDPVEGQGVDQRALEIDRGGGVRDREGDAIGVGGVPHSIEGFSIGRQLAVLIVIGALGGNGQRPIGTIGADLQIVELDTQPLAAGGAEPHISPAHGQVDERWSSSSGPRHRSRPPAGWGARGSMPPAHRPIAGAFGVALEDDHRLD